MGNKKHWTSLSKSLLAAMVIAPLVTVPISKTVHADDRSSTSSSDSSSSDSSSITSAAIVRYMYNGTLISNVTVGNGNTGDTVSDYSNSIPTGYQIVGDTPTVKYGETTTVKIEPTNSDSQSTNVATILYQYKGQTIRQATISGGAIGESVGDYSYENPDGYTIDGNLPTATYGQTTIVPVTKNSVNTKITFYYNGKELSDTTYTTKPNANIDFSSIVPDGYQSSNTSFTTGDYDTNYNINLTKNSDNQTKTTTVNYKYNNQTVGQYQQTSTNGDTVDYQNNVPDGYKLVNSNQTIKNSDKDQSMDVNVEPINAATTVNFISNGTIVGSQTYTTTYGKTVDFKNDIPKGYQLSNSKTVTSFKNDSSNKVLNILITNISTTSNSSSATSSSSNSNSSSSTTSASSSSDSSTRSSQTSSSSSSNSSNTASSTDKSTNTSTTASTSSTTSSTDTSKGSSTFAKSSAANSAKAKKASKTAKNSSEAKSKANTSSEKAKTSNEAKSSANAKSKASTTKASSKADKGESVADSKVNQSHGDAVANSYSDASSSNDSDANDSDANDNQNMASQSEASNSSNRDNSTLSNQSNVTNSSSSRDHQSNSSHKQKLPQTGEASTNWFTALGIVIISLSGTLWFKLKRLTKK